MSEIARVVIRVERADGSVTEMRAAKPAGVTLRFTGEGIEAVAAPENPVVFDVAEF